MNHEVISASETEAGLRPLEGFDRAQLQEWLYQLLLIRHFEEKAAELYLNERKIGGYFHLSIGQEAVAVGAIAPLQSTDYVLSSYRDHAHAIAKGVDCRAVMAELYGRSGGCARGKGGSMHLFSKAANFLGGQAIIGSHLPIAVGTAFASKYRDDQRVTLCFFGDATVNIGAFHEALNLASLWNLPVIFVCENNGYGMGTALAQTAALPDLAQRVAAYKLDYTQVEGQDLLAVYEATRQAVERARAESRPTFIEARTYRFAGHSISDPAFGHYRTKTEMAEQRQRDPIQIFKATLREHEMITDEELSELAARAETEIEAAVRFADESPPPAAEELRQSVYKQEP